MVPQEEHQAQHIILPGISCRSRNHHQPSPVAQIGRDWCQPSGPGSFGLLSQARRCGGATLAHRFSPRCLLCPGLKPFANRVPLPSSPAEKLHWCLLFRAHCKDLFPPSLPACGVLKEIKEICREMLARNAGYTAFFLIYAPAGVVPAALVAAVSECRSGCIT